MTINKVDIVMERHTKLVSEQAPQLTQHAMLVAWGRYAVQIGLVEKLLQIDLKQKRRTHSPQTKVIEFLVSLLGGLAHLQDISRSAHPLDQDKIVAEAWEQAAWADYSGVSRTLHSLSAEEAGRIAAIVDEVSSEFIKYEIELALQQTGYLVYDGDLTGRPVSSTSTSYPDTAFGYMGDAIQLGYQSALVSLHSPTYGRLWLSNRLHPGDTVSSTQARALVAAAESRTGAYPRRRPELVMLRIREAEAACKELADKAGQSAERLYEAQKKVAATTQMRNEYRRQVFAFENEYKREQRQPTSHCKLTRARRGLATYQNRLPRTQRKVAITEQRTNAWIARHEQALANLEGLRKHHEQLQQHNANNAHPVRIVLRLDAGFSSCENLYWLIEMGYDVFTKSRSTSVRDSLIKAVSPESIWQQVGRNAWLTAWSHMTVDNYFAYPLNVALAAYQLGDTVRHAVFLHYGSEDVTADLDSWFHTYNGRQTIEAGIKEGKGVFQMHHLKVRSPHALMLQEHFAAFAANFVRFSAAWFVRHRYQLPSTNMGSVKQMVSVGAHTSAWVHRRGDNWFLTFTEHSFYAGQSLYLGNGPIQLPLPLFSNFHF